MTKDLGGRGLHSIRDCDHLQVFKDGQLEGFTLP